jgi:hypothetical protein
VVFARSPEPGRVKTRMTPPLSAEQGAALYACLLADVLEESARAARALGLCPVLAVDPPEATEALARRAPPGFRAVPQRGADLGRRMERAVAEAGAAAALPVLLRGSDSPTLDVDLVGEALAALGAADLVLCPDRDGGYSLVGLARPAPDLFRHPMSTPTVLRETLAGAQRLGLRTGLLAERFDLDTVADFDLLAQVRSARPALPCPRTLAYLDSEGLWDLSTRSR